MHRVEFEMQLSGTELADLHQMTPYYWSTPASKRARIEAIEQWSMTASFQVFDGVLAPAG